MPFISVKPVNLTENAFSVTDFGARSVGTLPHGRISARVARSVTAAILVGKERSLTVAVLD